MLQRAEDQLFEYDQAALQLSARPSAIHESTLSSHTDSPCYPASLVPLQPLCGDFHHTLHRTPLIPPRTWLYPHMPSAAASVSACERVCLRSVRVLSAVHGTAQASLNDEDSTAEDKEVHVLMTSGDALGYSHVDSAWLCVLVTNPSTG